MFFQNVLHHWFLSLIWLALAVYITPLLLSHVVKISWYEQIFWHVSYWERWPRIIFRLVVILISFVVTVATLPIMYVVIIQREAADKRRRGAEELEQQEKYRIAQELKQKENLQRQEARKNWLAANRPKLYYNTVGGIIAVLRPDAYEKVRQLTMAKRRDGFWENDKIYYPSPDTIIFVTKQGKQLMEDNLGADVFVKPKMAGWVSDLDQIVAMNDNQVDLIRAEEIFVPWVNKTLLSFAEQHQVIRNCYNRGSYFDLVESQAPQDLLPLM